ncbi:hypothetical protein OF83DRAFT_141324 [Amylostereum chailletii]|nr:hypothetical protein OF83DRAFT_141324 [Amylostereum chailletii]
MPVLRPVSVHTSYTHTHRFVLVRPYNASLSSCCSVLVVPSARPPRLVSLLRYPRRNSLSSYPAPAHVSVPLLALPSFPLLPFRGSASVRLSCRLFVCGGTLECTLSLAWPRLRLHAAPPPLPLPLPLLPPLLALPFLGYPFRYIDGLAFPGHRQTSAPNLQSTNARPPPHDSLLSTAFSLLVPPHPFPACLASSNVFLRARHCK